MSRILLSYIGYPVGAGKFLKKALRHTGHEVIHCGAFTGGTLPWKPEQDFSAYADKPDIVLPMQSTYPLEKVLEQSGKVDLIIQCDANFFLTGKASCPNVVWAIDNHVAKYDAVEFDVFFGAHSWAYGSNQKNFVWLPCAYSPSDHYTTGAKRDADLAFAGVVYQHRLDLLNRLSKVGRVRAAIGLLGEEYNNMYNSAHMALCLSACGDLPMRVFENAAQGAMIFADYQKDLEKIGLRDGVHYVGFSSPEDAVVKFEQLVANPQRVKTIAESGHAALRNETYEQRVYTIFETL